MSEKRLQKTITSRMLELKALAIHKGVATGSLHWLEQIGIENRQVVTQIKAGQSSFRLYHIYKACELVGVSTDYVFGRTTSPFAVRGTKKLV